MNFRTDLALEKKEFLKETSAEGITSEEKEEEGIKISTIEILNEKGEKLLEKKKGKYITIDAGSLLSYPENEEKIISVLSKEISKLLPKEGSVLVVGLGNESITPDALGPECVSLLLATRHIKGELAEKTGLSSLRSVGAIAPGVLGKTGIETVEIISALSKELRPAAIITVDALASRRLSRLGTTVQLTDSGISPGSGVGNSRPAIDRDTLGVPVIAIGIPTVVDAGTMAFDIAEKYLGEAALKPEDFQNGENLMMVTPKEIDLVIERAAMIVAMSINCCLQPTLTLEEILKIVC